MKNKIQFTLFVMCISMGISSNAMHSVTNSAIRSNNNTHTTSSNEDINKIANQEKWYNTTPFISLFYNPRFQTMEKTIGLLLGISTIITVGVLSSKTSEKINNLNFEKAELQKKIDQYNTTTN